MAKLTLSVDEGVVARAKKYAAARDTSVSKLVEDYLDGLEPPLDLTGIPDYIVSLIGIAEGSDPDGYKKHLARKYS